MVYIIQSKYNHTYGDAISYQLRFTLHIFVFTSKWTIGAILDWKCSPIIVETSGTQTWKELTDIFKVFFIVESATCDSRSKAKCIAELLIGCFG